jgi:hypothetical protein
MDPLPTGALRPVGPPRRRDKLQPGLVGLTVSRASPKSGPSGNRVTDNLFAFAQRPTRTDRHAIGLDIDRSRPTPRRPIP